MRTRAYRPEGPVGLEDRSLQSGVAGLSSDPVVLPRRQLNFILDHMRSGFILFNRYHDVSQIRSEIDDVVVKIPFERVDGLDVSIDRTLSTMRQELSAGNPNALGTAFHAVIAATLAEVRDPGPSRRCGRALITAGSPRMPVSVASLKVMRGIRNYSEAVSSRLWRFRHGCRVRAPH